MMDYEYGCRVCVFVCVCLSAKLVHHPANYYYVTHIFFATPSLLLLLQIDVCCGRGGVVPHVPVCGCVSVRVCLLFSFGCGS